MAGPGNVGRAIRCPYHSWTYGLDGALHIAPYFGGREPRAVPPGFDRRQHGLVPVRSAARADRIETLWREVHREDHAMLERLQQGRASDVAAGGGVLSPVWEDSVRSFQELVMSRLR